MTEQQIDCQAQPLTPGRWLVRSLCWVSGCQAGTRLLTKAVLALWSYLGIQPSSVPMLAMLGSGYASIFLIWRHVLAGSSAVLLHDPHYGTFSWAGLVMMVWRAVIVLMQLFLLSMLLLFSAAMIGDTFFHEPMGDYF